MSTEPTQSAESAPEPAQSSTAKGASFFARIPKPVKIGAAGVLALALVAGGTAAAFAAVTAAQEQAAKDRYTAAVADLRDAITADAAATGNLGAAFVAAQESHAAGTKLAKTIAGLVDQGKLDDFTAALAALNEATELAAADAAVDLADEQLTIVSASSSKVDKAPVAGLSIDEFDARTAAAEKATSPERKSAKAQSDIAVTLEDAVSAVDAALIALPVGLSDLAIAVVNAHPSAGQQEKDAVVAAAKTVLDDADADDAAAAQVDKSLTAYAAAVAKLKESHAAVEAQKAAEAALRAAQEAGAATYTDPSTGEVRENPSYSGGGSSGGGGGSYDGGGSGSTGGGSNGGGGAPSYPSIYYTGSCHSGQYGSGSSAGNSVGMPDGASLTSYSWNGGGWDYSWQCPTDPIGEDW